MTEQPQQVPYQNVPPPPPQRTNWVRWMLIGGGGCLMLVVLMFIGFAGCLAAIGGSGGEATTPPENDYASIQEQAVPVGEMVEVGNVAWTVNAVEQTSRLSAFGETKTGNFVVVDLTFINNGSESVTLDSNSLAIIDNQNRTHETDPDASLYVPTNRDLFLNQVNPGVATQGRAIFNVAPDAQGLVLRAGDTEVFSDQNAYIDLGI